MELGASRRRRTAIREAAPEAMKGRGDQISTNSCAVGDVLQGCRVDRIYTLVFFDL